MSRPGAGEQSSPPASAGGNAIRIAVVAAVVALVWAYVTYLCPVPPWHAEFDLKVYRGAVIWWTEHKPLYAFHRNKTPYGFTYPPFAALVMIPWSWFSEVVAMVLNEVLSAALVVLISWWLVAPVARRRGWSPWFVTAVAAPLVYVMEPVRETMGFGQVNLILVALVVGDVVAIAAGRRWGGVGIGIATATKLTPGLFVVYLALTGRRRQAWVAAGTAAGATLLAFAVAPGTSTRFWTTTLFDTNRVGKLYYASNQSIMGVLARVAQPGQPSTAVWGALALVVLVGGMWRARQAFRRGDELAGVTLTGLVTCLVSPISWTHHLFWVVPAAVVLLDVAGGAPVWLRTGSRFRPRTVAWVAGAGAAVVIAVFVLSTLWLVTDHSGHSHPPGAGPFLALNLYMFVLLALVAWLPARVLRGPAPGQPGADALSEPAEPSGERTTTPPRPAGSSPR